jgi:hypothetical protein
MTIYNCQHKLEKNEMDSRFGLSKASHSSFPTPPTLDAACPWAVEARKTPPLDPRALRCWHEHLKTINASFTANQTGLSMFAEQPVIRSIDAS